MDARWVLSTTLLVALAASPVGAVQLDDPTLDAALEASGFSSGAERTAAVARLEQLLSETLQALPARGERARGRRLLELLHGRVLQRYDARATTLRDILEAGRFNCVSASLLYNLAAERAGLRAEAELLPTHARSRVLVDGESVVVETTSALGFQPSAQLPLEALAGQSSAGQIALVGDAGLRVKTELLVAIMWINRGVAAQEAGRLDEAERLFAEGERRVSEPTMAAVLREQRASLLVQLALAQPERSADGRDPALGDRATDRAIGALESAARVGRLSPELTLVVAHNVRALLERAAVEAQERGALDRLDRLAAAPALGLVAAQVATETRVFIALQQVTLLERRGELEAALQRLAAADSLATPSDAASRALVVRTRRGLLRRALIRAAEGATLAALEPWATRLLAEVWTESERAEADALVAQAQAAVGARLLAKGAVGDALGALEAAHARAPETPGVTHNLVAALQRQVMPDVEAGRCAGLGPTLARLEVLRPGQSFGADAELRCWLRSAEQAQAEGRDEVRLGALRAAYRLRPQTKGLAPSLAAALLAAATREIDRQACAAATPLLDEAGRVGASANALEAARRRCR